MDTSVEPPGNGQINPRTFHWTIDTLRFGSQAIMNDISGTSPSNVYVVGHSDFTGGVMWHFDGKQWSTVQLDPNLGLISLHGISSFEENIVFAVGQIAYFNPNSPPNFLDSSLVLQYKGNQWIATKLKGSGLSAVWGNSPASVWAVGSQGTAFYFDGTGWTKQRIRDDLTFNALDGSANSYIHALGGKLDTQPYDSIAKYLCYFDGSSWSVTDSLLETFPPNHSFGTSDVWVLDPTEVYSAGYGIFKKAQKIWVKIFDDGTVFGGIAGSANDNIFAVGSEGSILHFNGQDWYRYNQLRNLNIFCVSVWTDGTEVFVLGTDYVNSYVFHGK